MRDSRIVYLEITSWRGISIGAVHWYGRLVRHRPYETVELKRKLTVKSADKLNESRLREFPGDEYPYVYYAGFITNGFDSELDIKRKAKKEYKKHFPDAKILLLGDGAYEPHLVLDGPKELVRSSRLAIKQCEALGWWDKGNDDRVKRITDKWESAVKKAMDEC